MADTTPNTPVEVTFLAEPTARTKDCADISLSFHIDPLADEDLKRTISEFFCFLGALGWHDEDVEAAVRSELDSCF
jgi:hypothetical protein